MPNVKCTIAGINKAKLEKPDVTDDTILCKCRQTPCPLDGNCEKKDIVYKAVVEGPPDNKCFLFCILLNKIYNQDLYTQAQFQT